MKRQAPMPSGFIPDRGMFLLSRQTTHSNARAAVARTFNRKARTITFSEMQWLDERADDFVLAEIFRKRPAIEPRVLISLLTLQRLPSVSLHQTREFVFVDFRKLYGR